MRYLIPLVLFIIACLYAADTNLDGGNGDPFYYFHAAQTLRAGQGLRNADTGLDLDARILGAPNEPLTTFPPLYPVILALFGGTIEGARILNALSLWAALLMGWVLLANYGVPVSVRIGAIIAFLVFVLDSTPIYKSVLSESLFIPLYLAWLLVMPKIENNFALVGYSLLSLALGLTRYIGVPFVFLGMLWVCWKCGWRAALAYLALPGLGLTWWFTRNYYLIGRITGHSVPGLYTWLEFPQLVMVLVSWGILVLILSSVVACLLWCFLRLQRLILRLSSSADS